MQGYKSFITYDVIYNFGLITIWCKHTDLVSSKSFGALLCFALDLGIAAQGILERFMSYMVDEVGKCCHVQFYCKLDLLVLCP